MKRVVWSWLVCFALWLAAPAMAQQEFEDVELKSQHVRGNIYMINGTGGNIGVSVGEDGILIIDDKFAPLADKIRAALEDMGPGELKFILNTHYHGDHTGANPVFGPDVPILAHTNVRKRLQNPPRGEPTPKEGWPVITFDHSVSVHFNGEEIKVIHFPRGHTDGDSVIFFTGSNVVHMGDDFFNGIFPFVDLDGGGNVLGMTRNIEKILEKLPDDVKIIPGHGPLATVDDLKEFHTMLVETTEHVRQQMLAGSSRDQVKAEGLPEKWTGWGWQFIPEDRWIDIVWGSLIQKKIDKGHRHH